MTMSKSIEFINKKIIRCEKCPRLRHYCKKIAKEKRKSYLEEVYWGKPVPGWGDPQAQLMIVGLAPAAHGANRTGRIFTGDRSGEWLYRALYRYGFANQPSSDRIHDGLKLKNAYISCVVHCAPPDNKPTLNELKRCSDFLDHEINAMPQIKIWVALGQIAFQTLWKKICPPNTSRPQFSHGKVISLEKNRFMILSYHPSQQNTFTGRLTEKMFDSVWETAKKLITDH